MNLRSRPLVEIVELNTLYFLNCLDGVDDETARIRPGPGINNMAYLALHMVDSRHELVEYAGGRSENPYPLEASGVKSIDDVKELPPLAELRAAWESVAPILVGALDEIADRSLDRESPRTFPVVDPTVAGGLAFLLEHESFHIGQLSFLRRFYGLEGMSYYRDGRAHG